LTLSVKKKYIVSEFCIVINCPRNKERIFKILTLLFTCLNINVNLFFIIQIEVSFKIAK